MKLNLHPVDSEKADPTFLCLHHMMANILSYLIPSFLKSSSCLGITGILMSAMCHISVISVSAVHHLSAAALKRFANLNPFIQFSAKILLCIVFFQQVITSLFSVYEYALKWSHHHSEFSASKIVTTSAVCSSVLDSAQLKSSNVLFSADY